MKKTPNTTLFLVIDIVCIMLIIGMIGYNIYSMMQMPETIPIHWTKDNVANGWGSRWLLLITPGATIFIYASFIIGIKYLKKQNHSIILTSWLKLGVIIWLALTNWNVIQLVLG